MTLDIEMIIEEELDALDAKGWYDYLNALSCDEKENDLGRWKM